MSETNVTLEVGADSYPGRLAAPDEDTKRGVLVVPGLNHGPFGDVFDRFAEAAATEGFAVARFETWTSRDDLAEKTDDDYATDLEAGVSFLGERGCTSVAVVAKSFGGRLALEHHPDGVDRLVLWAPAVLFGDHEEDPSVTASELGETDVPTRVLQGDADETVSIENATAIADHLPNGEVVELTGEDHSFRTDEERVVAETLAFLTASR